MRNNGNRIPEAKRKEIAFHYSETESYNRTAKHFKISPTTVKKIVIECKELVDSALKKKKKNIDNFIKAMQEDASKAFDISNMYLEELSKPAKVKATAPRDAATVYGIIVDKQLKLEEIRLKRLEAEIKAKELAALEKGVSINISPSLGSFGKRTIDE